MDFGKVLGNPIVLIGGGAIGLILLLKGAPASAAASTASGYDPNVISANVAMNAAALGAQTDQTQIMATVAMANYGQDTTRQANTLAYLAGQNDNLTQQSIALSQSNAGITNNLITTNASIITDAQDNANRLGLAYVSRDTAKINADASVDIAHYQYKGVKASATASAITGVAGVIGGVAKSLAFL